MIVRVQIMTPKPEGAVSRNKLRRLLLIGVSKREVPECGIDVSRDFCEMEVGIFVYLSHPQHRAVREAK